MKIAQFALDHKMTAFYKLMKIQAGPVLSVTEGMEKPKSFIALANNSIEQGRIACENDYPINAAANSLAEAAVYLFLAAEAYAQAAQDKMRKADLS